MDKLNFLPRNPPTPFGPIPEEVVLALPAIAQQPMIEGQFQAWLLPQEDPQDLPVEAHQALQFNPLPDPQLPELNGNNSNACFNLNLNVNLGLTNLGPSNSFGPQMDPGLQDYLGCMIQTGKPNPDLYGLWAKYFSPVGCLEHVVHIPSDWAPFFIGMLLSPSHFEWAKNFLGSKTCQS